MLQSGELDFFARPPEISAEKLIYKNTPKSKILENIKRAVEALENLKSLEFEDIKNALTRTAENGESRGELLHPVRFALTGLDRSPDPFIVAQILGKDETIKRLEKAN